MISETPQRPSALNAFFSGGTSGLVSGAVMTLIVAAITPVLLPAAGVGYLAAFGLALGHTAPIMILASTLFGGVMSAKRAMFDAPHGGHHGNDLNIIPVSVPTMSGPAMAPVVYADNAPEQAASKSWAAETGRSDGANSRIQQILADGSMSDKDRASAILASRESADQQASRA